MRLCRCRKDNYADRPRYGPPHMWCDRCRIRIQAALLSPPVGVDSARQHGIMCLTPIRRCALNSASQHESKTSVLRRHHALNARPQAVTDPAFSSGNPFFDRDDLVQVKYEMLRRVRAEGDSVTRAAASFGFSRPSYYETQTVFEQAGLPGLVPQRPGPRRAHKLSEEVVGFLVNALANDSALTSAGLALLVHDRFGLTVHPRSIERALARRKKGGLSVE